MKRGKLQICILFVMLIVISSCVLTDPAETATLTGRVVGSSSQAISGVSVVIDKGEYKGLSTLTDADGAFKFDLPRGGICSLAFTKQDYLSQSKIIAVKSGEEVSADITLKTIVESTTFTTDLVNQKTVQPSIANTLWVNVTTNQPTYTISCPADWLTCTKLSGKIIQLDFKENQTLSDRTTQVTFSTPIGLTYSITITQLAGPVLRLVDYIGKDGLTTYPATVAFLTFNRDVTMSSVSSSVSGLDLTKTYSEDKKTVYFNNLVVPVGVTTTISWTAQAIDGVILSGKFSVTGK